MMYDAMRERFQESFESSIIFKEQENQVKLDLRIVNSFIEQMEIRVYMPKDFIIKAGSNDENFYFILDGNALMFGIDDNLIGILSSGSHFSCNIGNS
jgi:signal-transduction protein with cAMP-binding, CBS, and nucleotidyltransferase domain